MQSDDLSGINQLMEDRFTGMQTMNQAILELIHAEEISVETGLKASNGSLNLEK